MGSTNRDSKGRFIKGHKPTKKMIEKDRISHLGKTHTKETKKKISKSKKGQIAWNKGIENKDIQGEKHHNWNGGKYKDVDGYILIYSPKHPRKTVRNYVAEHRLVMEEYLGRYLKEYEVVHHINGNRSDNRLDNLVLFDSHSKHMSCHKKFRDKNGRFICHATA